MLSSVSVPVSIGELCDKISILEIKVRRIHDKSKLINITFELTLLNDVVQSLPKPGNLFYHLNRQLKSVNETLWDYEELIRNSEKKEEYGQDFVKCCSNSTPV